MAWTSPTIPILTSENSPIPMTLEETSYLGIIPYLVAILYCPIVSTVIDIIGRKYTLLIVVTPQLIGWLMLACAQSRILLFCARTISGLTDGGILIAIPIYLGETLEPKIRGKLVCLISTSLYMGQLVVNIVGSYSSISVTAFICSIFPAIFIIFWPIYPESPYYLLMKGKHKEAEVSLNKLRKNSNIQQELHELELSVRRQMSEPKSMKDFFRQQHNRSALFVAVGLRIANQLSGITAFTMYTQHIFKYSASDISSITSSIIFFGLLTTLVLLVSLFIDKFGRRPLSIISSAGCTITLGLLSIYFAIEEFTSIDTSLVTWLPIVLMMLFIIVFCLGHAMIPTVMLSELFSVNMKGTSLCVMNIFTLLCIAFTSKIFQIVTSNVGMFASFLFFAVCSFFSSIFCYYCVPETKGKTLEEIQQIFLHKARQNAN
ncbi:hypothetical protein RI129_001058 [Pyrocoelia pectoralis]|uniref:Major facilitator superfamily (MFS) profile domain-containing protein n=1 Tax=Pyrocoelia pectoralis TaxID=417401 RepID=A0AAN7VWZ1_9COLE